MAKDGSIAIDWLITYSFCVSKHSLQCMSNYLRELLTDPRYSAIVEKVKRETPPPLEYESGRTPEDWIEASGVRKGWMACAQYFGVNYD